MALLGPSRIKEFVDVEIEQMRLALNHDVGASSTNRIELPAQPGTASEDSTRADHVGDLALATVGRAIADSLAKAKPPKSRRSKAKKQTRNARKMNVDLTGAKEDSDFLKELDRLTPRYWESLRAARVAKEEHDGNDVGDLRATSAVSPTPADAPPEDERGSLPKEKADKEEGEISDDGHEKNALEDGELAAVAVQGEGRRAAGTGGQDEDREAPRGSATGPSVRVSDDKGEEEDDDDDAEGREEDRVGRENPQVGEEDDNEDVDREEEDRIDRENPQGREEGEGKDAEGEDDDEEQDANRQEDGRAPESLAGREEDEEEDMEREEDRVDRKKDSTGGKRRVALVFPGGEGGGSSRMVEVEEPTDNPCEEQEAHVPDEGGADTSSEQDAGQGQMDEDSGEEREEMEVEEEDSVRVNPPRKVKEPVSLYERGQKTQGKKRRRQNADEDVAEHAEHDEDVAEQGHRKRQKPWKRKNPKSAEVVGDSGSDEEAGGEKDPDVAGSGSNEEVGGGGDALRSGSRTKRPSAGAEARENAWVVFYDMSPLGPVPPVPLEELALVYQTSRPPEKRKKLGFNKGLFQLRLVLQEPRTRTHWSVSGARAYSVERQEWQRDRFIAYKKAAGLDGAVKYDLCSVWYVYEFKMRVFSGMVRGFHLSSSCRQAHEFSVRDVDSLRSLRLLHRRQKARQVWKRPKMM